MMSNQVKINGKLYQVGKRIGKGGEGEVYTLQDNKDLALKIYTIQDKSTREQKISAMVNLGLAAKYELVSFPVAIARTSDGAFLGFVMRLLDGHKPLHELYSPGSRKVHFPQADYRFLVRVATNIARAVASVHKSGCVIGDINHSGMLISAKAVAALIDADSFQITTSTSQFLCKVAVPEYTPPELQGKNLSSILRTQNHDAFGLAVVIFQVLFMGRHPFVGTVRSGDIPPLHENIKNFRYVYTENRNVGMDQPPGTPSISDFSSLIAENFELAFSNNVMMPRPSAEKWVKSLEALEASLVKCDENPLHYIPRDVSECPWCEMEKQLSTILFLPYIAGGLHNIEFHDPGAANFNIDMIWRQIEAVSFPVKIEPRIKPYSTSASAAAITAKSNESQFFQTLVGVSALIALIFLPAFFIIWLPVIYWAFTNNNENKRNNSYQFTKVFQEAENRWAQELNNWHQRTGAAAYTDLKNELIKARDEYKHLLTQEPILIKKYREQRKEKQFIAFLDTFDISSAKITGIGPAKEAALSSYGIDTAADISLNKLLRIQGFGNTNSQPLIAWRDAIAKRFVYQPNENEFDRQEIIKIRSAIHTSLAALRPKLSGGATNLSALAKRVQTAITIEDPMLSLVHKQRLQARVDLEFLGIPIPAYTPPAPAPRPVPPKYPTPSPAPTPQPSPSPKIQPPQAYIVTCPKCGSSMAKRLARRGKYAGSYFWGCTRYPSCKGTRNI